MFALLTRRKETPMPDTATPAVQTDDNVLMRFLTQGGAEVHVTYPDCDVQCLGCDYQHSWSSRVYARSDANEHATACRAMPKPNAV